MVKILKPHYIPKVCRTITEPSSRVDENLIRTGRDYYETLIETGKRHANPYSLAQNAMVLAKKLRLHRR